MTIDTPNPSFGPRSIRTTLLLVTIGVVVALVIRTVVRPDFGSDVLATEAPATPESGRTYLIAPIELNDLLTSDANAVTLLDLSGMSTYENGHLPGAIHAWWQDGMDPYADSYGQLLAVTSGRQSRAAWFRSLGIDPDREVVVYDDARGAHAARMLFILNYIGFTNVRVLDGGLDAWKRAGYAVATGNVEAPEVAQLKADLQDTWLITTNDLAADLDDPELAIVDVRTDDERDDDLNGTIRTGMIPGSISLPWTAVLQEGSSLMLGDDDLATLFSETIGDPTREIVLYGEFGMDTAIVWLALREAGYTNVRIYDEGWATWGKHDELPIAEIDSSSQGRRARYSLR